MKNLNISHEVQRRADERLECDMPARIASARGDIACRISNLSAGGASITLNASLLSIGERVRFLDGPLAGVTGDVRWASSLRYGLQFERAFAASSIVQSALRQLV